MIPCKIGGKNNAQSAIPIQPLKVVPWFASIWITQAEPNTSIIPITKQIFITAFQPPNWFANTPIVALEKNIGIKPGMIRIGELKPSNKPTATN